ncbi:hypothetical protein TNCT_652051 [Trichonephila clavata]|uniref:DUF2382 domain-containing protein n=1 Tax=Trichonephila clavata TaxID=2740835 RepID=A0A8X6J3L6_TRICU|nr:hypothetical protein TNCT_652051 [Trichonephila clavata]
MFGLKKTEKPSIKQKKTDETLVIKDISQDVDIITKEKEIVVDTVQKTKEEKIVKEDYQVDIEVSSKKDKQEIVTKAIKTPMTSTL